MFVIAFFNKKNFAYTKKNYTFAKNFEILYVTYYKYIYA